MSDNKRFGVQNLPGPAVLTAVAAAALVIVVAVFVTMGQQAAPSGQGPAGSGAVTDESTATLTITGGGDAAGSWTLDGVSGDVSPTDTLIAAVWTETADNVAAGYGDLVTVSLGGPVFSGTRATSAEGITLSFGVSRMDAAGNDIFAHQFTSKGGECQVTMATGDGVSGSFTCSGVSDGSGTTVSAEGTFRT